jgi:hypothetical protein
MQSKPHDCTASFFCLFYQDNDYYSPRLPLSIRRSAVTQPHRWADCRWFSKQAAVWKDIINKDMFATNRSILFAITNENRRFHLNTPVLHTTCMKIPCKD